MADITDVEVSASAGAQGPASSSSGKPSLMSPPPPPPPPGSPPRRRTKSLYGKQVKPFVSSSSCSDNSCSDTLSFARFVDHNKGGGEAPLALPRPSASHHGGGSGSADSHFTLSRESLRYPLPSPPHLATAGFGGPRTLSVPVGHFGVTSVAQSGMSGVPLVSLASAFSLPPASSYMPSGTYAYQSSSAGLSPMFSGPGGLARSACFSVASQALATGGTVLHSQALANSTATGGTVLLSQARANSTATCTSVRVSDHLAGSSVGRGAEVSEFRSCEQEPPFAGQGTATLSRASAGGNGGLATIPFAGSTIQEWLPGGPSRADVGSSVATDFLRWFPDPVRQGGSYCPGVGAALPHPGQPPALAGFPGAALHGNAVPPLPADQSGPLPGVLESADPPARAGFSSREATSAGHAAPGLEQLVPLAQGLIAALQAATGRPHSAAPQRSPCPPAAVAGRVGEDLAPQPRPDVDSSADESDTGSTSSIGTLQAPDARAGPDPVSFDEVLSLLAEVCPSAVGELRAPVSAQSETSALLGSTEPSRGKSALKESMLLRQTLDSLAESFAGKGADREELVVADHVPPKAFVDSLELPEGVDPRPNALPVGTFLPTRKQAYRSFVRDHYDSLPAAALSFSRDDKKLVGKGEPLSAGKFTDKTLQAWENAARNGLASASVLDRFLAGLVAHLRDPESPSGTFELRENIKSEAILQMVRMCSSALFDVFEQFGSLYGNMVLARRDLFLASPHCAISSDGVRRAIRAVPLSRSSLFGLEAGKAVRQEAQHNLQDHLLGLPSKSAKPQGSGRKRNWNSAFKGGSSHSRGGGRGGKARKPSHQRAQSQQTGAQHKAQQASTPKPQGQSQGKPKRGKHPQ